MRTTNKPSIYEQVTDRIIAALDAGTLPWHRPWRASLPKNAVSGREYRSINSLILQLTALERDYASSEWMTYRQAQQLGGQVRRGEKGTAIVWWNAVERSPTADAIEREGNELAPERYWIARTYHVFNRVQVDGLVAPQANADAVTAGGEDFEAWERLAAGYPIEVRHGGDGAFYCPDGDYVQMPHLGCFESRERYCGVLAHELVHSTGARHRLDRDLSGRFGSESYAMEELVAELGSAFLTARCGLPHATQTNAAYLQSWLRVMREDNRAIFTAARHATQAAEYIRPADQLLRTGAELDPSPSEAAA